MRGAGSRSRRGATTASGASWACRPFFSSIVGYSLRTLAARAGSPSFDRGARRWRRARSRSGALQPARRLVDGGRAWTVPMSRRVHVHELRPRGARACFVGVGPGRPLAVASVNACLAAMPKNAAPANRVFLLRPVEAPVATPARPPRGPPVRFSRGLPPARGRRGRLPPIADAAAHRKRPSPGTGRPFDGAAAIGASLTLIGQRPRATRSTGAASSGVVTPPFLERRRGQSVRVRPSRPRSERVTRLHLEVVPLQVGEDAVPVALEIEQDLHRVVARRNRAGEDRDVLLVGEGAGLVLAAVAGTVPSMTKRARIEAEGVRHLVARRSTSEPAIQLAPHPT